MSAPLAPRFRSTIRRTPSGSYILTLIAENGRGGSQEFATQDAAFAGIMALYAEMMATQPAPRETVREVA